MAAMLVPAAGAVNVPDEDDLDESIRKPIRRVRAQYQFGEEMKKVRDEKVAKQKKEEEKKAKKEAKKKGKADERRVVETRQQPASTADKSLMMELLNKDYSLTKYEFDEPKPITWHDDPVATDVAPLMASVKGARRGGATLYTPHEVTMQRDANEVFFAFEGDGTHATGPLSLCVYYYADDPLNYNDMVFTIDGFDYTFRAANPSRGKLGARMYWEQSNDALTAGDKDLVYALSHCHWARMSLKGADGINHVKMLTQAQLDAFAHTLELYRAMGGTF